MRTLIAGTVVASLLAAGVLAGCSGESGSGRPSSFTSAALPGGGQRTDTGLPGTAAGGGALPRAVEEADIIKNDGAGHLYVVNQYRGLEVIDVGDPDAPRLAGRAAILGHPVDMYFAGGLAYVIVSDYFTWWWDASAGLSDFHGSRIMVFDVTDPAAPALLSAIPLEGFVSQTRRVGDILYAVSNQYSWLTQPGATGVEDLTYVVSIDMADPADVRQVDRVDFPGAANQIHATADALFVAQPRWTDDAGRYVGTTHIQHLDISDPGGAMALRGATDVPGYLDSKLQLDASGDVLRVLTHDGSWGAEGSQRLGTYRVGGGKLAELGHLDLPASGGLFGVRFDGDRAYFATMVTRDPLEIADLADPAHPTLLGSLAIDGTLYQIVTRPGRLIALGTLDGTWAGVGVSLFDVSDASHPALLGRAPVTGGDTYAWTQAFWDDRAFEVIDDAGVVVVPFEAWDPASYTPTQGVRLVHFDEHGVDTRGLIDQSGAIQRAFVVGGRLGTLSELSLVTSDIADLDHPRRTGEVELVRNVIDYTRTPSAGVELLGPRDYWRDGETLRLRTVANDHVDDGVFRGEVALPELSGRMFTHGDLVYVLGQAWDRQTGASHTTARVIDVSDPDAPRLRGSVELPGDASTWYYGVQQSWGDDGWTLQVDGTLVVLLGARYGSTPDATATQVLTVIDLGDPDYPAVASTTDLGAQWGWGLLADGRAVYLTHAVYTDTGSQPLVRDYMDRIDLADPAHPVRAPAVNIPGVLVAVADHGARLFTVDYQWDGVHPVNSLDTLTVEGDTAYLDQAFPLPEQVSRVRPANGYLYFTSQAWSWSTPAATSVETTLRTVDVRDAARGAMREVSARSLAGAYSLREIDGGHLFLETSGFWWWGGLAVGGSGGGVAVGIACALDGPCGWYGYGVDSLAVFSFADPARPEFVSAARVNGWIMSIVVDGDTAYLPSGLYGVQSIPLSVP